MYYYALIISWGQRFMGIILDSTGKFIDQADGPSVTKAETRLNEKAIKHGLSDVELFKKPNLKIMRIILSCKDTESCEKYTSLGLRRKQPM